MKLKAFIQLSLSVVALVLSYVQSTSATPRLCYSALSEMGGGGHPKDRAKRIETLDDLLKSFSQGMVPDLSNPEHRAAFNVYLKMRFGQDVPSYVTSATVDRVAQFLGEHPDLSKTPLSPVRVDLVQREYPVTEGLQTFIRKQKEAASKSVASLFQVEANVGDWKNILQLEDVNAVPSIPKEASKEEKQRLREEISKVKDENKKAVLVKVTDVLGADVYNDLKNTSVDPVTRATALFQKLSAAREVMKAEGKDIKPISQAMVDLVHSIPFQNRDIQRVLKEGNGLERITALRRAITDRDNLAYALGYSGHFPELLEKLEVNRPTGLDTADGFERDLVALDKEVLSKATFKAGEGTTRWVRSLSLAEAPLRSCLGLDCSSSSWLTTALHPNYQFYTWTDESGASTGHISITMGSANKTVETERRGLFRRKASNDDSVVKIAFVNKIQNVPPEELPAFLEGVRLSLEKEGYLLGIPEDLGENLSGHGGISNSSDITRAVKLIPRESEILTGFSPHSVSIRTKFDQSEYDRSNLGLSMRVVSPLKANEGLSFAVEPKIAPQKLPSNLRLQDFVEATYRLRESSELEDRMRYIPSMDALQKAGLRVDPKFEATLNLWLKSENENFKLRKQVALYLWQQKGQSLSEVLSSFSISDRAIVLQNLIDTPRYKKILAEQKGQIPELVTMIRSSKKVRTALLQVWVKGDVGIYEKVLDAEDISPSKAAEILRATKTQLNSTDLQKMIELVSLVNGTSIAEVFSKELQVKFVENVFHPVQLSKALSTALESESPLVRKFAEELLNSKDPRLERMSILRIYREIRARGGDFVTAAESWMRDGKIDPMLKTELLLAQESPWSKNYEKFDSSVPKEQREILNRELDRRSKVRIYRALAEKAGAKASDLSQSIMESYLLVDAGITRESPVTFKMGSPTTEAGRYGNEAQQNVTLTKPIVEGATDVTQLQYYLVTGKNPSKFVADGEDVTITIKGTKIDPNRPVEMVSQEEAIEYSKQLNQLEKKLGIGTGTARLPTDAEYEWLTRRGTTTAYSFGDDVADLDLHAWHYQNSNSRTHRVASKRPDSQGGFDHHGNVWKWTLDTYKESVAGGTDPLVSEPGSPRVVRGGSWNCNPQYLRSAYRSSDGPGTRYDDVGFRLVSDLP